MTVEPPRAHEASLSHWTEDGRFHTGPFENCVDCPTRPDARMPERVQRS